MAGSLNKVMIIGNLGRDPELRYTQRGTAVCNFTVAVNRPGRVDANGDRAADETEWFSVVAWDKLAETCSQYLAKGRKVYVEGRLQTRSWEGQDGQTRQRVEILAQQMTMLDSRQSSEDGDWTPRRAAATFDEPTTEPVAQAPRREAAEFDEPTSVAVAPARTASAAPARAAGPDHGAPARPAAPERPAPRSTMVDRSAPERTPVAIGAARGRGQAAAPAARRAPVAVEDAPMLDDEDLPF